MLCNFCHHITCNTCISKFHLLINISLLFDDYIHKFITNIAFCHLTNNPCQIILHTHAYMIIVTSAPNFHYDDVIMTRLASQITSLTVVYSIVYSGVNQRKHQSSASLAFVREIHRGPVNFPHKWPVTRKMFPFDDVIMSIFQILLIPSIFSFPHFIQGITAENISDCTTSYHTDRLHRQNVIVT